MKFQPMALLAVALLQPLGARAGDVETVRLTLGTSDSTCNYDPLELTVVEGEGVHVELVVPSGVQVAGWSCRGTLCSTDLVAWRPRVDVLEIDVGEPLRLGAAPLFIDVDPSVPCLNCDIDAGGGGDLVPPTVCCACPCDFVPKCD